jgi:hypothetical protein
MGSDTRIWQGRVSQDTPPIRLEGQVEEYHEESGLLTLTYQAAIVSLLM